MMILGRLIGRMNFNLLHHKCRYYNFSPLGCTDAHKQTHTCWHTTYYFSGRLLLEYGGTWERGRKNRSAVRTEFLQTFLLKFSRGNIFSTLGILQDVLPSPNIRTAFGPHNSSKTEFISSYSVKTTIWVQPKLMLIFASVIYPCLPFKTACHWPSGANFREPGPSCILWYTLI